MTDDFSCSRHYANTANHMLGSKLMERIQVDFHHIMVLYALTVRVSNKYTPNGDKNIFAGIAIFLYNFK